MVLAGIIDNSWEKQRVVKKTKIHLIVEPIYCVTLKGRCSDPTELVL
jgi:hypothetical protein